MKRLVLVALLGATSCGALNQTGACDFRPKEYRCQERDGLPTTISTYEATCKAIPNAAYHSGSCDRAGVLGGCDMSETANPVRDWYYADAAHNINTAADVMAICQMAGKPFLSP